MNKREFVLTLVLFCLFLGLNAQSDTLKNPEQFLFPEFSRGKIAMKTGKEIELTLNYNILSEKIVYVQNGKILGISNPASVDTIYINGRKLIPFGKVFYEILAETPVPLFVQNKGVIQAPPKMDPYGRASEASSTSSINSVKVGKEFYTITDQVVIISKETVYWVRIKDSMLSFRDASQFMKIFPDLKNEIRAFIKLNKIRFDIKENVRQLVVYANSQVK